MKRPINRREKRVRYAAKPAIDQRFRRALERFHTMSLRLAGFMHQFKTPLHIIQSQSEFLLEDPSLPKNCRTVLDMIHKNAERLAFQTRTLMDLARGNHQGEEVLPVEKLLDEVYDSARSQCRMNNVVIEKDIQATSPIRMEPVALEGALHNLVNNAMEAMPKGGLLRIRTFEIPDLGRVGVEISDNGSGMDRRAISRLKHPLQSTKANGTGLGVYITRHILRRHHAQVRWQSEIGKGTKITILFPKAVPV
jgi:signal transduction histidine kinase